MQTTMGDQFARAVAAQDPVRLRGVLAEGIDFEALTPGRHWAASTSKEVVEIILGPWFGPEAEIAARDGDERLTEQELLSTIFQLIVAGRDTTASLLGNGTVAPVVPSRAAGRAAGRP